jgi:hypothetical protein
VLPAENVESPLDFNPLDNEARALRDNAERTGRFLVNCLPSLSVAERPHPEAGSSSGAPEQGRVVPFEEP